jgi:hypothetical protein
MVRMIAKYIPLTYFPQATASKQPTQLWTLNIIVPTLVFHHLLSELLDQFQVDVVVANLPAPY